MQTNMRICEICKVERREDTDREAYHAFGTFRIGFEGAYSDRRYEVTKGYLHLCPPCMEKIGVMKRLEKPTGDQSYKPADQLYELIAEIVREAMQP